MKLKNQYYILRHGETIYQKEKKELIYSKKDNFKVGLKKEAIKKIKKLSKEKIKNLGIDLIFASDFLRTKQTAEIVAKELKKKIIFDKRLRDVNLGVYQGRRKEEFYRKFSCDFNSRLKKRPKNGENWADVIKRIINFLTEIEKKHQGMKILIVSHGDPLLLLEGTIKGWSPKEFDEFKKKNFIKAGELRKLN